MLGVVPAEAPEGGLTETRSGKLLSSDGKTVKYSSTLNEDCYIVQSPDILAPASGVNAREIFSFSDTARPAGYVIDRGRSRNMILSIPLENYRELRPRQDNGRFPQITDRFRVGGKNISVNLEKKT